MVCVLEGRTCRIVEGRRTCKVDTSHRIYVETITPLIDGGIKATNCLCFLRKGYPQLEKEGTWMLSLENRYVHHTHLHPKPSFCNTKYNVSSANRFALRSPTVSWGFAAYLLTRCRVLFEIIV